MRVVPSREHTPHCELQPDRTRIPRPCRENMGTHTKVVFVINCITFAFCVAVELFLWCAAKFLPTVCVTVCRPR